MCLRVQTGFASSVEQAHFSSAGLKSRLIHIFSSASQLRIACRTGDSFGCLPRSMAGRSTGTRCGEVLNSFVAKLPLRNQLFCLRPVPQHPRARQVRGKGNTTQRTMGASARGLNSLRQQHIRVASCWVRSISSLQRVCADSHVSEPYCMCMKNRSCATSLQRVLPLEAPTRWSSGDQES